MIMWCRESDCPGPGLLASPILVTHVCPIPSWGLGLSLLLFWMSVHGVCGFRQLALRFAAFVCPMGLGCRGGGASSALPAAFSISVFKVLPAHVPDIIPCLLSSVVRPLAGSLAKCLFV